MPIFLTGGHFQSCHPIPLDAGFFKNSKGASYHWTRESFPIPVNVDSTLPPHMIFNLKKAADEWNELIGAQVFEVYEVPPENYGILGFPNWGTISVGMTELGRGKLGEVLGKAEVHLRAREAGDRGEIHSVNMWFDNDLDHQKIFNTALHELGHCLGLSHDGDPSSVMYPVTKPGQEITYEDIIRIRNSFL